MKRRLLDLLCCPHCHGVFQQRRRLLRAACLRLDDSQQVERLEMLCVMGEDPAAQPLGESEVPDLMRTDRSLHRVGWGQHGVVATGHGAGAD